MRRIDRTAARQGPDQLEVGEGEQHRKRHHHRDDRRQQRIGDEAEALPGGRAVECGSLVERGRHRLQPGQERDRDERHAAPDVGEDHAGPRHVAVAEKIDVLVDQPHLDQRPGDDRELRIVDPPERDRGEHRRHDEGDQHGGADQRLERHMAVQQQRQIEANDEFDGGGDDRIEQRVEHRQPEDRVVFQPLVILDTDEHAGAADAVVGETHPDAEKQRIGEEQDQERRGRQHEPQRQPVAVGAQPVPGRRFSGMAGGRGERRLQCGHSVTAPFNRRRPLPVIARSPCDEAIQSLPSWWPWIAASLRSSQ